MKILVLSDLHIEFIPFQIDVQNADLVVLAGDIHVKDNGLKWIKENIKNIPVVYVLGNHEYYGETYPKLLNKLKNDTSDSNIHFLENDYITLDGIHFLGCTLWTDFNLFGNPRVAGYECQQVMSDFKRIRISPRYSKIRAIDIAAIHNKSKVWLSNKLDELAGLKSIVITHHAPSKRSIPKHYQDDIVSSAYASHLDKLIEKKGPNLWIHGHLHNSSNYLIVETQVLSNPRGYPDEANPSFDDNYIIEI